jgi:predicted nucleic acid-binding protein
LERALQELVEPKMVGNVCRDPDDDKFLEAALGGKADILISGDHDLLSLSKIQGIPIVSPSTAIKSYLA